MRILVCVKRVPAPGARISLTTDERAIDTRHLSFTVSPHEECAVEEAIRLKEKQGGSATVMIFGPPESEEQLRYAISVGIDEAVLIANDGSDFDPQATAAVLSSEIRRLEEEAPFDLILFGNESADAGGYQVGIRVAHALGRPIVSGAKAVTIEDGNVDVQRPTDTGVEVYRLPLPAIVAVKEGINLPRYPTLPGRLRAKKAEIQASAGAPLVGGLTMERLVVPPEQVSSTTMLGRGPEAAPAVVDLLEQLGLL
ncbi:MAG TPA: electron transfer flavoprotein subunit beta/FixA family protein [Acidimicrobiia bacterium]